MEKKIDFNFSESDNSEKTEELKTELKETTEIGPNTLLNLPQPLIELIKSKIKDKNSSKKDDKDKEENTVFHGIIVLPNYCNSLFQPKFQNFNLL